MKGLVCKVKRLRHARVALRTGSSSATSASASSCACVGEPPMPQQVAKARYPRSLPIHIIHQIMEPPPVDHLIRLSEREARDRVRAALEGRRLDVSQ